MRWSAVLSAAMACVCSGCVFVHETRALNAIPGESGMEIVDTVEIETNGWFLFDVIPIASGDPAGGCRWFRDTLHPQTNLDVIDGIIRREGATHIGSMTSHETTEGVIPLVLNRHTFRTSVTLLRRGAPESASGPVAPPDAQGEKEPRGKGIGP